MKSFLSKKDLFIDKITDDNLSQNNNWDKIGLYDNNHKYYFDLNNGMLFLNEEFISVGKEINGYFVEFSNRNLNYREKLSYYCESYPLSMNSRELVEKNIYIGYECNLKELKINYGFYQINSCKVMMVYDCVNKRIGLSQTANITFFINNKNIDVIL